MRILFVCTGNTCRSAMAESIARQLVSERGLEGVEVESAGTSAWDGSPASDASLLVSMERAIDLSGHKARLLSPEIIQRADLILTMGPHHLARVDALGGKGKAHLLTSFAGGGDDDRAIHDPFGGDLGMYRATFDELREVIGRALERVAADRGERR